MPTVDQSPGGPQRRLQRLPESVAAAITRYGQSHGLAQNDIETSLDEADDAYNTQLNLGVSEESARAMAYVRGRQRLVSALRHKKVVEKASRKGGGHLPLPTPDEFLDRREKCAKLELALGELPPEQQAVVRLRVEGRSFKDVAAVLGGSEEQQRQVYFRVMIVLRARLVD